MVKKIVKELPKIKASLNVKFLLRYLSFNEIKNFINEALRVKIFPGILRLSNIKSSEEITSKKKN